MGYVVVAIVIFAILGIESPETKVVLLDNNKTKNEISLTNKSGVTVLDKTNTYITVDSDKSAPSKVKSISKKELNEMYGDMIKDSYNSSVSLLFYFDSGSTKLTQKSKEKLQAINRYIKQRYPCDVSVIGHADRQGSDEYNIKLSLKRANMIYRYIKEQNLSINSIEIKSFGENDPVIKTKEGVAEPLNRRVEVMIR